MGGWEMSVEGEAVVRECPYCEGEGCSECDGTGQRVTTFLGEGDTTIRVQGSSAVRTVEERDALIALAKAAQAKVRAELDANPRLIRVVIPRSEFTTDRTCVRWIRGDFKAGTFRTRAEAARGRRRAP